MRRPRAMIVFRARYVAAERAYIFHCTWPSSVSVATKSLTSWSGRTPESGLWLTWGEPPHPMCPSAATTAISVGRDRSEERRVGKRVDQMRGREESETKRDNRNKQGN